MKMGFIWTILIGLVVGVVAKLLHPGKEDMGFIMTALLGIAGSFVAGMVGQFLGWYKVGETAGFIASVIAAFVILFAYGKYRAS